MHANSLGNISRSAYWGVPALQALLEASQQDGAAAAAAAPQPVSPRGEASGWQVKKRARACANPNPGPASRRRVAAAAPAPAAPPARQAPPTACRLPELQPVAAPAAVAAPVLLPATALADERLMYGGALPAVTFRLCRCINALGWTPCLVLPSLPHLIPGMCARACRGVHGT